LLSGEPGIGKTRLAGELARGAHEQGANVLYGRCDEGISVPFQPFVEALQYFVARGGEGSLRESLGHHAGELVRLVPEIAGRVAGLPERLTSDPATERYRLFDAVTEWLRAASVARPLLLVVDDIHWADAATLMLLRHVVRATVDHGFAIITTHRDTEIDRAHPLTNLLADLLSTSHGITSFHVSGLDEPGVMELFEHASGERMDEQRRRLAQAIHLETAGNPFFVTEAVRSLTESGSLKTIDVRRGASSLAAALSEPIRDVVLRRVRRLSPTAADVLALAAVMGVDFDLEMLSSVSVLGELDLIAALEEATAARLIDETGVDQYRFAHALVRSALYETLSASRRARMHLDIACTLEKSRPSDVVALARHFVAAGRNATRKAIEFTVAAGDHALERLAHDQAVEYYEQALALLGATVDEPVRCDLLSRLGTAQKRAGHRAHRETLLAAARLAIDLGDTPRLVDAALTNNRGWVSASGAVDLDRVSVLEAALDALPPADSAMHARLLATLSVEVLYAPDQRRHVALSDEALAMARRLGDPATLAHVLNVRGHAIWSPNTLEERLANSAEHVATAALLSDPLAHWYAAATRPQVCMEAGEIAEVDRQLEVLAALTKELGQPHLRWAETIDRSWRALLAGRLAVAETLAMEAYQIGSAAGQADALLYYAGQLFAVRFEQGRLEELLPLLERGRDRPKVPAFRASLALAYLESRRPDDARPILDASREVRFELPMDVAWTSGMTAYAEVAARLRAADAAAIVYERLLPWSDQIAFNGLYAFGSIARSLGLLADVLDDLDGADVWFARAAAKHDAMRAPTLLARTYVDWAETLIRRGRGDDRGRARVLLGDGLAVARDLGLGTIENRAAALLAS